MIEKLEMVAGHCNDWFGAFLHSKSVDFGEAYANAGFVKAGDMRTRILIIT
jgi:hypothetical protein